MTVRLSKLHGLGNDFLIHLTDDVTALDEPDLWSGWARRWCDRQRGIGADGLILGVRGQEVADLVMVLHNADGSRAEMSGNGIRCLAHAEARRREQPEGRVVVATDGGRRVVDHRPDPGGDPLTLVSSVDMGAPKPGPVPNRPERKIGLGPKPTADAIECHAVSPRHTVTIDLGNPHLVLLVDDPAGVDIGRAGPGHEAAYHDGINVHVVASTTEEADAITMATWERGVGVTQACGTGAAAAALAANQWGLVGTHVTVHMPGGDVTVEVGETLTLHGPSVHIADIEVAP
ncbi:MAG: diaminopimelate epimerase [Acidimicrobiales bacterium]